MSSDVTLQLDLAFRLLVAAALGAAIGIEREIHAHPAGMRTHLLVALGSAIFTELSIYSFIGLVAHGQSTAPDPTRIAAQIVTGIGFLGAGAIVKYGTSIRGLTTAGSLWATAAVGMAAGAGAWVIAAAGTVIVVFSLWPLHAVARRIASGRSPHHLRIRLQLSRLAALGAVSQAIVEHHVEIVGIDSERLGKGRYEVDLELNLPAARTADAVLASLTGLADVEVLEVNRPEAE